MFKKQKKSSILKKKICSSSRNATDSHSGLLNSDFCVRGEESHISRRVSFANTYQVKEIHQVVDITETWPLVSTDVDTGCINGFLKHDKVEHHRKMDINSNAFCDNVSMNETSGSCDMEITNCANMVALHAPTKLPSISSAFINRRKFHLSHATSHMETVNQLTSNTSPYYANGGIYYNMDLPSKDPHDMSTVFHQSNISRQSHGDNNYMPANDTRRQFNDSIQPMSSTAVNQPSENGDLMPLNTNEVLVDSSYHHILSMSRSQCSMWNISSAYRKLSSEESLGPNQSHNNNLVPLIELSRPHELTNMRNGMEGELNTNNRQEIPLSDTLCELTDMDITEAFCSIQTDASAVDALNVQPQSHHATMVENDIDVRIINADSEEIDSPIEISLKTNDVYNHETTSVLKAETNALTKGDYIKPDLISEPTVVHSSAQSSNDKLLSVDDDMDLTSVQAQGCVNNDFSNAEDMSFTCIENGLLDLDVSSVVEVDTSSQQTACSITIDSNSCPPSVTQTHDCSIPKMVIRRTYNDKFGFCHEVCNPQSGTSLEGAVPSNVVKKCKLSRARKSLDLHHKKTKPKPQEVTGSDDICVITDPHRVHKPLGNHVNFIGSDNNVCGKHLLLNITVDGESCKPSQGRLDEYYQLESSGKYTDCMLSASMVSKDDSYDDFMKTSSETVLEHKNVYSLDDHIGSDIELFNFDSLSSCSPNDVDSSGFFIGNTAVVPRCAVKRPFSEDALQNDKQAKRKKSDMFQEDSCYLPLESEKKLRNTTTSLPQENVATQHSQDNVNTEFSQSNPIPVQDTFSMLTSMTNNILFQNDLSGSIGMEDFLRDYTDVRLGTCKKCFKKRQSLVVTDETNKRPETLHEILTVIFSRGKHLSVYKTFASSIWLKLESLEKDVERLEDVIKDNNPEVMKRIRFDSEQESERMKEEVEELSRRCKDLVKVCWKESKSKLLKGLTQSMKTSMEELEPLRGRVLTHSACELLQSVAKEMEAANNLVENDLRLLQCQGEPPSDEQMREFDENNNKINQLTQRLDGLTEENSTVCRKNREWKHTLEDLWRKIEQQDALDEKRGIDAMKEKERQEKIKEERKLTKKFLFWEILKDDLCEKCYGFLKNSLLLTIKISQEDSTKVESYEFKSNLAKKWIETDMETYKLLHNLIHLHVNTNHLLNMAPSLIHIPKAIAFVSRHVACAVRLQQQIVDVSCRYNRCSLKVDHNSIIVDFYGHEPNLCCFQLKFNFGQNLHPSTKLNFNPTSYKFLKSSNNFGKFRGCDVMDVLSKVPQIEHNYFIKLVESIISMIESP